MDASILEKGTHFQTQSQAVQALQHWFEETDEETIGDGSFKRAQWISFDSPACVIDLNADTNRRAVERMLQHSKSFSDNSWHVVANKNGKVNKIVFNPEDTQEGWYAYARQPLAEPTMI